MSDLKPAWRLDVVDLLPPERAQLVDLLGQLGPDDWDRETDCPAWTIKGIALHLLGDDLSLLSRQRDGAVEGMTVLAARLGVEDRTGLLDRFNEEWVDASTFMSAELIVELLELSGRWTHEWYRKVDPEATGESVAWISPDPAPYWLITAREYLERWIHQQQIRRALGHPSSVEAQYLVPAVAVVMRAFPNALTLLSSEPGISVAVSIDTTTSAAWTLVHEADRWVLYDGAIDSPSVALSMDPASAAGVFSREFERAELHERIRVDGDSDFGTLLVDGLAAFFEAGA